MHQTLTTVLNDARFHELLLQLDQDLAAPVRAGGCPTCSAVLHSAPFTRKPRGVQVRLSREHRQRLSFCCAKDGCRQRATPPSLRFLGRKVYLGGLVVLISALRCGPTPTRLTQLQGLVGVSRRTVLRWRRWWREVFTQSVFWRAVCADFMPPVETAELPASLLVRFVGQVPEQLNALLRFLAPATAGTSAVRAL
jgi:hypothetical protein